MRLPVRAKLVLAVGLPLLAVYGVTVAILGRELGARSTARLETLAEEEATLIAHRVDERLGRVEQAAETIADVLARTGHFGDDLGGALAAAPGRDPLIVRAWGVLGADGSLVTVVSRIEGEPASRGPATADELPHPAIAPWPPAPSSSSAWTPPAAGFASYVATVPGAGWVVVDARMDALAPALRQVAGEGGTNVTLAGEDGRVLASSLDERTAGIDLRSATRRVGRRDFETVLDGLAARKKGLAKLPGLLTPETRWYAYAPLDSIRASVIVAVPDSLVTAFERSQLRSGIAILSAGLVAILLVIVAAAAIVTRPVARLAGGVARLGTGDLEARVEGVTAHDELGDLARAFNTMVGDLKEHVEARQREAAAREKVENELRVARRIQNDLLPKRLPAVAGLDLFAKNLAARHVAGDFYDAFALADGRLVFLVADVSGKGLPSAMYMAVARTVLRRVLMEGHPLADAIARASDALEAENVGSMYLTVFAGLLDPSVGTYRYVNAGHPPPWRVPREGTAAPVGAATGAPVGLFSGTRYEEGEARLEPGDRLVVFSDGVPEARRSDGEFYGEARLAALLAEGGGEAGPALGARVIAAVEAYQSGDLADDVTVMVVARSA